MTKHTAARRGTLGVLAVLALSVLPACNGRGGSGLWERDLEPVVLTGAQVPRLAGAAPGEVVAFRWNSEERGWEQVPVQVDERHLEFLTKLRNGSGTTGPKALAYSDPDDNAGLDPVAALDADDELAFMAADTGGEAPPTAGIPASVMAATGTSVRVVDPLATSDSIRGTGIGFVYLFRRSGPALTPSAGRDYVQYQLSLTDPMGHAEDSTVSTNRYSTHFSARWTRDRLAVGSGPDILDRHRNLFGVGNCVRSEDTFSAGAGGYASNVDGPVRAIRSYLGANSGTYTQREHVFYRSTERVQTFLRVHAIPGIIDLYDLSAAAIGMRYSSSSTPAGVVVDGNPDTVGTAVPTWEAVTGTQGSLVSASTTQTDIVGLTSQAYYQDDSTPPVTTCTGDGAEYGAGGTAITSSIPNTDPTLGAFNTLTSTRWNVYLPDGEEGAVVRRVENLLTPLTVSVAPYPSGT